MKYIKGNQIGSIESYVQGRITLRDGMGFNEDPWIGKIPNTDTAVLLNHALAFTPHESWGAIVPNHSFNFLEMLAKQELTLHPEAWDIYIKENIIDEEGNHLKL
jgi:hypothetical protein